jgi:hypothetical protein
MQACGSWRSAATIAHELDCATQPHKLATAVVPPLVSLRQCRVCAALRALTVQTPHTAPQATKSLMSLLYV